MRIFSGISVFALGAALQTQAAGLSGRVVQAGGAPVPEAVVELKTRGTATKTAADGTFSLDVNTAIGPGSEGRCRYRLHADFLEAEVRVPLELRMDVSDGAGRSRGSVARHLAAGSHRIGLAEALPDLGREAGLYFLTLRLDGRTATHPFFSSGNGPSGTVFAPASRDAAAKRTATIDTLRVRKAGYSDFTREISSYTAGDLGDLILTAAPDNGNVCAVQHAERTSDGIDVVVCDALFDSPPRVHLPAATPSSAYALMTGDAFVTPAGESYPHTQRNSGDPEMLRHASALYAIQIRNGAVESARPAIVFAESLFLAPLKGKAFEGLISKRTSGRYGLPTLPVRVQVSAERFTGGVSSASAFRLKASISNLAGAVAASDGSCMPALSSYGSEAPFDGGTDVALPVGRVPSMHGFGDDELVFELLEGGTSAGTIMSRQWFFTPLDLVKNTASLTGTYSGVGHGTPGYIPLLDLKSASGGGGACN